MPFSQGEELAARHSRRALRAARKPQPHPAREASPRGRCSPRSAASSSTATPTSCLPCRCRPRRRSRWRSAVTAPPSDGARIAYAVAGEGFPIVKAQNWMTHLGHDWTSPVLWSLDREGVRSNRLVRSDMRGFGRSEWEPPNFDFEHHGRRSRSGDRSSRRWSDAIFWESPTARRSRLLMPRGTRSGCESSSWSTVSLRDGGSGRIRRRSRGANRFWR